MSAGSDLGQTTERCLPGTDDFTANAAGGDIEAAKRAAVTVAAMWPWGHIAVSYLLYSLGLRERDKVPQSPEVFLLGLGALLPDLVDKPLAWSLGVLDSARSLGHSALVAVLVLAVLYLVLVPRVGRSPVAAFGVGYLSHPFADLPLEVFGGEFGATGYFLWPLTSMPPAEPGRTLMQYLLNYQPGPYDGVQLGLVSLAFALWFADGRPGWGSLVGVVTSDEPTVLEQ